MKTDHGTSQDAMNAELQLLRAHVENAAVGPAIILVTSAEAGDGKSLIANSLAECLARTGRKTAVLNASRDVQTDVGRLHVLEGGGRRDEPVSLSLPDMHQGITREGIADFFQSARESFEFTIVDTTPLLASHRAMVLAGLADGIILTVRIGRAPTENDRMMVRVIEESRGKILGVVTAAPSVIERFAEKRTPIELPAEHVAALGAGIDAPTPASGKRRAIGTAVGLAVLCVSFLGYAGYQTGSYHGIAAAAPEPAKAFLHSIVVKMQRSPN